MSFLLSILAFAALLKAGNHAAAAALAEGHHHHPLVSLSYRAWDWFIAPLGPSAVEMIPVRYVVDPLSGVMLLVVTGVGTLIHVYSAGYIEPADLAKIVQEGAVGDVCTVLLREDGTWEDIELNRRATGPTPSQLQAIGRRVCVVADPQRAQATLGALRAGVATDLVCDDSTAKAVLNRL